MVTTTFVLLADLIPKRLALINPEGVALRTIGIMQVFIFFLKPIVWFFDGLSNIFFHIVLLYHSLDSKSKTTKLICDTFIKPKK